MDLLRGYRRICVQFVNEAKFFVRFDEILCDFRLLCGVMPVFKTTFLYKTYNYPFLRGCRHRVLIRCFMWMLMA